MQNLMENIQIYCSIKKILYLSCVERFYFGKENICERVDSVHFMKRYFDGMLCENMHYEIKTNGLNR